MDTAFSGLDLSRLPSNFITMMFQSMSLSDRFTCALVCKTWAEAATAATRSIILKTSVKDLSCLQRWLEKHGDQLEVLQLRTSLVGSAVLTALPRPQLQDLLLWGRFSIDSRVWSDIAAATKLTSVSLEMVQTASQQADVVSALTMLPDLEQLTWSTVTCGQQFALTDSKLLHKLTKLTALKLEFVEAAEALEHLGLLTRLQNLSLAVTKDWVAAGCPGLPELKALTQLELKRIGDIPSSVSQLTALQQLDAPSATPTALNKLSALTYLRLDYLGDMLPESPPLQLPGLQHFEVTMPVRGITPMSFLGGCTQLRMLNLSVINLRGPGSLVASSMLQHLKLRSCRVSTAGGAADPVSWQQVFPGPGRLPHLTALQLLHPEPALQHAHMEGVVACCSSLQVLHLGPIPDSVTSIMTRLSGLTSLTLWEASDQQCSSLAQVTGLRELGVGGATGVSAAGLRQLAALEQLTSLGLGCPNLPSGVLREYMSDEPPGYPLYDCVVINKGAMQDISRLPTAVLSQVLQHVPMEQRLLTCSLVCTQWAAAAAAATTSISQKSLRTAQLPALESWVQKHGQVLVSLQLDQHLDETHDCEVLLPGLLHLTSLELFGFLPNLQLPTSSSCRMAEPTLADRTTSSRELVAAGAQWQLPKLQRVSLGPCTLSSITTLLQLSSLTGITELSLDSVSFWDSSAAGVQQLSGALAALLQQLPHLHCLSLSSMKLNQSALAPLSTMQDPQVVSVSAGVQSPSQHEAQHPPAAQLLASLPSSLPHLSLANKNLQPSLPATTMVTWQLACLQKLELYEIDFHPAVLNGMAQLQELTVEECFLPADVWQGGDEEEPPFSLATAALLTAVGQMQELKQLSVRGGLMFHMDLPAHSFTALTVAIGLQKLDWVNEPAVPLGAVRHMFPEGKQLPQLHTLILESVFLGDDESFMTAADLDRVFAACPALVCLSVTNALQPGDERGLLNLPARCTHLSIGGMAMTDSLVSVVTQLTQLRSLFWQCSPGLTDIGLEQLTALRALTRLYLQQDLGLSEEVVQAAMMLHDVDSDYECLVIKQDGRPICKALCDLCDLSPALMTHRLEQCKQENAPTAGDGMLAAASHAAP